MRRKTLAENRPPSTQCALRKPGACRSALPEWPAWGGHQYLGFHRRGLNLFAKSILSKFDQYWESWFFATAEFGSQHQNWKMGSKFWLNGGGRPGEVINIWTQCRGLHLFAKSILSKFDQDCMISIYIWESCFSPLSRNFDTSIKFGCWDPNLALAGKYDFQM